MNRLTHGALVTVNAEEEIDAFRADNPTFAFGFMFSDLQSDDENLLITSPDTAPNLRSLGATMKDPGVAIPGIHVPAVHTFFGQFVDHDVTLERATRNIDLTDPTPLSLEEIASTIINSRSPNSCPGKEPSGFSTKCEGRVELAGSRVRGSRVRKINRCTKLHSFTSSAPVLVIRRC